MTYLVPCCNSRSVGLSIATALRLTDLVPYPEMHLGHLCCIEKPQSSNTLTCYRPSAPGEITLPSNAKQIPKGRLQLMGYKDQPAFESSYSRQNFLIPVSSKQAGSRRKPRKHEQLPSTTRLTHRAYRHPAPCTQSHCVRLELFSFATLPPSRPRCFTGSILFCCGHQQWPSMLDGAQTCLVGLKIGLRRTRPIT